ncbi:MerR family transcriptional regulator [marine bacterium AO1-C]|nr:MerR family transcriptional regulator [marine bacterium AO1-C]
MQEKYDTIGENYNLTRQADPYLTERMHHWLAPEKGHLYLDIGCGTGSYTIALAQQGIQFIGVEPSERMLDEARQKSSVVEWKQGKAEAIPLADEAVNGVLTSMTLHHWQNLEAGFKELYRVLKPQGKVVIFTSTPSQMRGYWLNHFFPTMLKDSIVQMPAYDLVESCLQKAQFEIITTEKYFIQPDLQDLFLYSGKHNPELYLKLQVRAGISSFASLANAKEVKQGLEALLQAIQTGSIERTKQDYQNDLGDYLFIVAQKL